MVKKTLIGFLLLVILTSSIYILLPDKVRIDVQKTKTLISVYENDKWVLGATEFLNLFDGTKKMRAKSREVTQEVKGNIITVTRKAFWKDNITTIHEYIFDSTISDVESTPINEKLYCFNCQGKIVHFEYRNIEYLGVTREATSPESFGHNIKVEWGEGYDWAKVYQQKFRPDKLIIRYRPKSDYEVFDVRLFDPKPEINVSDKINVSVDGPIKQCYLEYFDVIEPVFGNVTKQRTVQEDCLFYFNYTYIINESSINITSINESGTNVTSIIENRTDILNRTCSERVFFIVEEQTGTKIVTKSKEICRVIGERINGVNYNWDKELDTCKIKLNQYCCDSQNADGNGDGIFNSGEDSYSCVDIKDIASDNRFEKYRI